MTINVLKAAQRGKMQNAIFEGKTVFSNGMPNTNRPDNFGMIYIFNDDILYPDSHLGMHPHQDVEIVTIMIAGAESHRDTLGVHENYQAGEVQLISSGSGLYHAGGNVSDKENARHLQIWIVPRKPGLTPSVQVLKPSDALEKVLVSPDGDAGSLTINQDVWIYQVDIQSDQPYTYSLQHNQNGVLIYVLQGGVTINGTAVQQEDTVFVSDITSLTVNSPATKAEIILIETIP